MRTSAGFLPRVVIPRVFLCILTVVSASAQGIPGFTSIQPVTNREALLRLSVVLTNYYRLETSTNLAAWDALITLKPGAVSLVHTDSAAPYFGGRYYRAVEFAGGSVPLGDHLATTSGDAVIRPMNHATFLIQWNGLAIYNDPVSAAGSYAALPKADVILVSHDHPDHFESGTLNTLRKPETVILAPAAVYNALSATLKAQAARMTNGMVTNLLGLTIEAVPAYNGNHPKGTGNGYVVTLGGRRLYMSGDTGAVAETRALTDIDVAFLCMNVPYTMTVPEAADLVRVFRPRVVFPYHYRNQDGSYANLVDFKRRVGQDLGIEVRFRKWY